MKFTFLKTRKGKVEHQTGTLHDELCTDNHISAYERSLSYQVSSLQGIGRREEQQDSYATINDDDVVYIKQEGLFAVVADGMGGMRGGSDASTEAVNSMCASFEGWDREDNIAFEIKDSVLKANDKIFSLLSGAGGSTLVACMFFDSKLYYASVGDSSLYLMRGGELTRLNRLQNGLNREYARTISSGSMDPSYANEYNEKEGLTHFIGMEYLDDIDFLKRPLPLMDGDLIMLCSDGISSYLDEQTIYQCLLSGSVRDVCSRLEDEILGLNCSYQDNYTAIVIQCRH